MNFVDAICNGCGRPIRWACFTAVLCRQCKNELDREKKDAARNRGARVPLAV
jgi:predicted amidophosphoribosyltransferase